LDQTGELTPWGEDRLLVIGSRCGVFDIALGTILIALGTILPPLFIGWDDVSRGRSICVPGRNQYIPRSANEPD
jgi:hypothetical protein